VSAAPCLSDYDRLMLERDVAGMRPESRAAMLEGFAALLPGESRTVGKRAFTRQADGSLATMVWFGRLGYSVTLSPTQAVALCWNFAHFTGRSVARGARHVSLVRGSK
jgi:hypothetical protein